MTPALIQSLGPLALASRLRRVSERLSQDAAAVYREHGFAFEPRWFLMFYDLGTSGPRSITELAGRVGVTHPAVIQATQQMIHAGLLKETTSSRDRRRRLVSLSRKGQDLFDRLTALWADIREATRDVIVESGVDVLGAIGRVEAALDRASVLDRIERKVKERQLGEVEIVPHRPALARWFESLNREWLQERFSIEPRDEAMLAHPGREILRKGGTILYARVNGEVAGTCALVPLGNGEWELVKMAVAPAFRRRQIGKKLTLAMIEQARAGGARAVIARTSPLLEEANALYRALGFQYAGADPSGDYRRETVVFRMELASAPAARAKRGRRRA